jgi:rhodanese-related sulfurtransferase
MGYEAVNLKWGMTSWTKDRKAAPERFSEETDVIWQSGSYRNIVTRSLEAEKVYPLPDLDIEGENRQGIIWSAAEKYLGEYKPANISAHALYDPLFSISNPLLLSPYEDPDKEPLVLPFGVMPEEDEAQFEWPFVLDVRSENRYGSGHVPGSLHIYWQDVFKTENLAKLPPDRRIVVCSETGHTGSHITALLNILGYDAVNLKWGMSGWSLFSEDGKRYPGRYSEETDCMDYPLIRGWSAGREIRCRT